tara:strand:- start:291 stop:464 length:174 start_codon:yes stop_codon:yes gene_type:complete
VAVEVQVVIILVIQVDLAVEVEQIKEGQVAQVTLLLLVHHKEIMEEIQLQVQLLLLI